MLNLANQPARTITKEMQTHSDRLTPKQGNRSKFSPKVRKAIIERDNGLCVCCRRQANAIHHIIFRSDGGLGTEDNGCCVCEECHYAAHHSRKQRKWFEWYRLKFLLGNEQK